MDDGEWRKHRCNVRRFTKILDMRLGKIFDCAKRTFHSAKNLYILYSLQYDVQAHQVPLRHFALSFMLLLFILSALKLNNAECPHSIRNNTRKMRTSRACKKENTSLFARSFFVNNSNSVFRSQSVLHRTQTQHPCGHPCKSFWCIQLNVSILQCELVPYTFLLFSIYSTIIGCFQASVSEAGAGAAETQDVLRT